MWSEGGERGREGGDRGTEGGDGETEGRRRIKVAVGGWKMEGGCIGGRRKF